MACIGMIFKKCDYSLLNNYGVLLYACYCLLNYHPTGLSRCWILIYVKIKTVLDLVAVLLRLIFALRGLIKESEKWNSPLVLVFIDFVKADTIEWSKQ